MIIFLIPDPAGADGMQHRDVATQASQRCPVVGESVFISGDLFVVEKVTHHVERGVLSKSVVLLRRSA